MKIRIRISRHRYENLAARCGLNSIGTSCSISFVMLSSVSSAFTWGASWSASLSSMSSWILPINSFCVLSNCNGVFASNICHCHLCKGNVDAFPISFCRPHKTFLVYLLIPFLTSLITSLVQKALKWVFPKSAFPKDRSSDQCFPSDIP